MLWPCWLGYLTWRQQTSTEADPHDFQHLMATSLSIGTLWTKKSLCGKIFCEDTISSFYVKLLTDRHTYARWNPTSVVEVTSKLICIMCLKCLSLNCLLNIGRSQSHTVCLICGHVLCSFLRRSVLHSTSIRCWMWESRYTFFDCI